jgi:hypothetical protein
LHILQVIAEVIGIEYLGTGKTNALSDTQWVSVELQETNITSGTKQ